MRAACRQSPSTVLYPILETIYAMETALPEHDSNTELSSFRLARSSLVALNIVAQKWLRVLDMSYVAPLIAHACERMADGRPAVRVLGIRLVRMIVHKLPDFSLEQFKVDFISRSSNGEYEQSFVCVFVGRDIERDVRGAADGGCDACGAQGESSTA